MKKLLLFSCFVLIVACGSEESSSTASVATEEELSNANTYPAEFDDTFFVACSEEASKTHTVNQAYSYCLCVTEQIKTRYPYKTYIAKAYTCNNALLKDGTIERCAKEASKITY